MRREPFPEFIITLFNTLIAWGTMPFITVMTWIAGVIRRRFTSPDQYPEMYHDLAKGWGAAITRCARARVHLEGRENLEEWLESGSAVLVCNHTSLLDITVLLSILPGRFNFVAKSEIFRIPLLGEFIRRAGYISLKRGDRRDAARSLGNCVQALENGWSPLMFPEGTRTPDGKLQRFKRGAILLAARTGRPILPLAIDGIHHNLPRGTFLCRPGDVTVRVGRLIHVPPIDLDDPDAMAAACEHVREEVEALLEDGRKRVLKLRPLARRTSGDPASSPALSPLLAEDRTP